MSENLGKKIKVLAALIGAIGFIASASMAVDRFAAKDIATACIWVIFGILALFLIVPLFMIGNLSDELWDEKRKLRSLTEKTLKMEKSGKGATSVDKYSPSRRQSQPDFRTRTTQLSITTEISNGMDRTRSDAPMRQTGYYSATGTMGAVPSPAPAAVPRASLDTIDDDRINTETLITDTGVMPAREPEMTPPDENSFYTTSTVETMRVNRRDNSITRFLSPSFSATIAAGGLHTVAVSESGRVMATGYGTYGQCNVSDWAKIVAVAAGNHHTVGLRENGTCVATGYSGYGQCDVDGWTNVCAVSAGVGHTVGMRTDGTCVATGDNAYGQCNVSEWVDIIAISAGYNYTVGLRADGTIIAVGANTDGQWGATRWNNISKIASGGLHTVGLKSDGTCVACGNNANGQCEVTRWQDVRAVAAGNYHTVGLLSNGRVVAAGYNGYGQCNVSAWEGVVAIAAGRNHTLALTKNGELLSTGDNTYEQCNTRGFRNIKIIRE